MSKTVTAAAAYPVLWFLGLVSSLGVGLIRGAWAASDRATFLFIFFIGCFPWSAVVLAVHEASKDD